jgi:hypothetical protein
MFSLIVIKIFVVFSFWMECRVFKDFRYFSAETELHQMETRSANSGGGRCGCAGTDWPVLNVEGPFAHCLCIPGACETMTGI